MEFCKAVCQKQKKNEERKGGKEGGRKEGKIGHKIQQHKKIILFSSPFMTENILFSETNSLLFQGTSFEILR